jgi:Sortase domain
MTVTAIRSWLRSRLSPQRALGVVAAALLAGGGIALGVAASSQTHAPQPTPAAAGTTGPASQPAAISPTQQDRPTTRSSAVPTPRSPRPTATALAQGPVILRSAPVTITIPAIGVRSSLQVVGLNPDGTLQVPQPGPLYNDAAWYKYSPTPGQLGPSIIEGHIDSAAQGPSVFYRLGALKPGDQIAVTLADHTVAVFTVSGVRQYPKAAFPTATVYGHTNFAALRLLTCGGSFDPHAHSYLANTVVFASLTSSHPAT